MDYIPDTHSLVWYFTEDSRLSTKALQVFEQTPEEEEGRIIIPTVVLAEIMFIAKKGRITITFDETIRKIEENDNFDIVPLDTEILKEANKIELSMEMHDKLIIATALYFTATVITRDKEIKESELCKTIW
ncbi:MAG: PIN domain-containing protein [Chlamydiota bacterium]|nr:PIN domain-containing protein [Chlamydiota bacterium]